MISLFAEVSHDFWSNDFWSIISPTFFIGSNTSFMICLTEISASLVTVNSNDRYVKKYHSSLLYYMKMSRHFWVKLSYASLFQYHCYFSFQHMLIYWWKLQFIFSSNTLLVPFWLKLSNNKWFFIIKLMYRWFIDFHSNFLMIYLGWSDNWKIFCINQKEDLNLLSLEVLKNSCVS